MLDMLILVSCAVLPRLLCARGGRHSSTCAPSDTDGYADRHWIPGAGNVNWNELFAAIGELSQQPRLLLELYSKLGFQMLSNG